MKLKLRTGQRNNVSICSDSQAALKALWAAKTTSPLIRQCQQALNDISTRHSVGLYWVSGNAGVRGNEIADRLARSGSVHRFVGPQPFLGVSRQNIRRKMKRWMEKHHVVYRDRPGSWSLALFWLQGLENCPLIGQNPGLLLACSLDITSWEDIYI